jgi:hypothetical protein
VKAVLPRAWPSDGQACRRDTRKAATSGCSVLVVARRFHPEWFVAVAALLCVALLTLASVTGSLDAAVGAGWNLAPVKVDGLGVVRAWVRLRGASSGGPGCSGWSSGPRPVGCTSSRGWVRHVDGATASVDAEFDDVGWNAIEVPSPRAVRIKEVHALTDQPRPHEDQLSDGRQRTGLWGTVSAPVDWYRI